MEHQHPNPELEPKNPAQADEQWVVSSNSPIDYDDKCTVVRVVAHNVDHVGNDEKNAIALNHWSIYLVISEEKGGSGSGSGSAVRINMRRRHDDLQKWELVWTQHAFTRPYSALKWWDWKLTGTGDGICVRDIEGLLLDKGFDKFHGDRESGQGCRWWTLKTIELFATQGWIHQSAHRDLKPCMLFCYLDKNLATQYNDGSRAHSLSMVEGKFGFEEDKDKTRGGRSGNPFAEA